MDEVGYHRYNASKTVRVFIKWFTFYFLLVFEPFGNRELILLNSLNICLLFVSWTFIGIRVEVKSQWAKSPTEQSEGVRFC